MTDQSELSLRAALCRKLAQREPANRMFWMAEAENWSRLSKQQPCGEDSVKIDSGILELLRRHTTNSYWSRRIKRRCITPGTPAPCVVIDPTSTFPLAPV